MTTKVKIQFLYHSGFKVETKKHVFIFDYWQGEVNLADTNLSDQSILVFSSHNHPDHYNPQILRWQTGNQNIKYVLSSDISLDHKRENLHFISPYEEILVDDVLIKAFGSTDIGVSFLIKADDITFFHAGDLNWWNWIGEPDAENLKAGRDFQTEITRIKGNTIDIAFFPVDPRLEANYCLGPDYFIQEIAPAFLVPMHFGDVFDISYVYAEKMKDCLTKVITFNENEHEVVLSIRDSSSAL